MPCHSAAQPLYVNNGLFMQVTIPAWQGGICRRVSRDPGLEEPLARSIDMVG